MLIVRWGYLPNEVREALRPLLHQYLWLVPGWCRLLQVRYQQGHEGGEAVQAQMSVSEEYRWAELVLFAGWIDSCPTERRSTIIHELLHIPTGPAATIHLNTVDRLFEDGDAPKFRETLKEEWRRAYEASVQDLTFSILLIPESALPQARFREEEDEHPPLKAAV